MARTFDHIGHQNLLLTTHPIGECNNLSVGFTCPICMDVWVNKGKHRICCLPCGHIYGMSCIKQWLRRKIGSGKCPQCDQACSLKDVRKLYTSAVIAFDEEFVKSIEERQETLEDNLRKQIANLERDMESRLRKFGLILVVFVYIVTVLTTLVIINS